MPLKRDPTYWKRQEIYVKFPRQDKVYVQVSFDIDKVVRRGPSRGRKLARVDDFELSPGSRTVRWARVRLEEIGIFPHHFLQLIDNGHAAGMLQP